MQDETTTPYGLCQCGCGSVTAKAPQAIKRSGLSKGEHYRFLPGHYARTKPLRPVAERFWEKVAKRSADECWEWQGVCLPKGHGQFHLDGRTDGAHRVAYLLANGSIPHGLFVCHYCDNPPCCNPAHLWLGTVVDNNHDAMTKGRCRQCPETGRFLPLEG